MSREHEWVEFHFRREPGSGMAKIEQSFLKCTTCGEKNAVTTSTDRDGKETVTNSPISMICRGPR